MELICNEQICIKPTRPIIIDIIDSIIQNTEIRSGMNKRDIKYIASEAIVRVSSS